jgi:cytochrome c-type biogenesis protein CcmF
MISALGYTSLCAAVLVAAGGVLAATSAARFRSEAWLRAARWSVVALAALLTVTSAMLVVALLRSDFRYEYVAGYTERALPVGYKLAAFWAGQEGSLLLWAWLLGVMAVFAVRSMRRLEPPEQAVTLGTLAMVIGFFASLILFAADPFKMFAGAAPPDGRGLNPMLQDPGMIIHPPLLFLGYAGCTIPFAFLCGVLVSGREDNRWIAPVRRWLLVAWLFLTAGIVLGAWWAYIELGWGGYWAWDPVENASLLPWLTTTAVVHSITAQQRRGMFKVWNAVLIALSFILCIFGTYITRSGVIQSVHSFAPSLIGTFFLAFLLLTTVGSTALIVWRRKALRSEHELEGLISREGAFLLGNVLLLIMMLTTLVGTMFPLISSVFMPEPVTVQPAFYNKIVPGCAPHPRGAGSSRDAGGGDHGGDRILGGQQRVDADVRRDRQPGHVRGDRGLRALRERAPAQHGRGMDHRRVPDHRSRPPSLRRSAGPPGDHAAGDRRGRVERLLDERRVHTGRRRVGHRRAVHASASGTGPGARPEPHGDRGGGACHRLPRPHDDASPADPLL